MDNALRASGAFFATALTVPTILMTFLDGFSAKDFLSDTSQVFALSLPGSAVGALLAFLLARLILRNRREMARRPLFAAFAIVGAVVGPVVATVTGIIVLLVGIGRG